MGSARPRQPLARPLLAAGVTGSRAPLETGPRRAEGIDQMVEQRLVELVVEAQADLDPVDPHHGRVDGPKIADPNGQVEGFPSDHVTDHPDGSEADRGGALRPGGDRP